MPRAVGAVDVAMRSLQAGLRSVAPEDAGLDPGLGLPRQTLQYDFTAPGASTFEAIQSGFYEGYVYGGGGTGGTSAGFAASDGGGAGAARRRFWLAIGQKVQISVGATDQPSSMTLPDGRVFSATAGTTGQAGFTPGGDGGVGVGGDVNRRGGTGNGFTNPDGDPNTPDGTNTGTNPEGGVQSPSFGAGFAEITTLATTVGRGGGAGTNGDPAVPGNSGAAVVVGPTN